MRTDKERRERHRDRMHADPMDERGRSKIMWRFGLFTGLLVRFGVNIHLISGLKEEYRRHKEEKERRHKERGYHVSIRSNVDCPLVYVVLWSHCFSSCPPGRKAET